MVLFLSDLKVKILLFCFILDFEYYGLDERFVLLSVRKILLAFLPTSVDTLYDFLTNKKDYVCFIVLLYNPYSY